MFHFFETSFLGYNYAQHQNAQQSVRNLGCRKATAFFCFLKKVKIIFGYFLELRVRNRLGEIRDMKTEIYGERKYECD